MMEGLELEFRELAWRKTVVLFLIDFFQLLRILTLPVFGWSDATSGLIEKFDLVYDFTLLGSMVVPRYSFFILAFVVVTFALVETAYVARIFEQGSVKQMWPVKVLRFLVVVMVTTLFSSLVKWLLIPLSCLVSDEDSFSQEIHGEGTSCNPFRFPEILATVPTLIVGLGYITFAFVVTIFSMQVNVLSRAPRSSSTGRVEILFLANKVAATCLSLLCNLISPTAVAAVLCAISLWVFWLHANTLPFHHHPTNVLRGGIYGATAWATIASTVVSLDDRLPLQWALIGLLPVAFLLGTLYVHSSRARLIGDLDRLRGEYEQHLHLSRPRRSPHPHAPSLRPSCPDHSVSEDPEREDTRSRDSDGPQVEGSGRGGPAATGSNLNLKSPSGRRGRGAQSAREQFYDTNAEKRRIFVSGRHALACARVLLYKRRAEDKPFLEYVIERGLENFRDFQELQVFRILVLATVMEKQRVAKVDEKSLKEESSVPIDLRYLLFCFERKTTQELAAHNLGKAGQVQISAINLMEFNLGLTKAKLAHRQAITALRNCWRLVYRLSKGQVRAERIKRLSSDGKDSQKSARTAASASFGTYQEVVALLEQHQGHAREAQREYLSLLYKFPSSVELLFSYSSFLDVCLNQAAESDRILAQAVQLQDGDGSEKVGQTDSNAERLERGEDGRSAASGSTTEQDRRKVTQRFVGSWQHKIMGQEAHQLSRLVLWVKASTLLLVVTATVAFVLSDFVLFKGMTKAEMHRITSIGELYTVAVAVCHHTRSLFLAANWPEMASLEEVSDGGQRLVVELQAKHVKLHSDVNFPEANEFFNQRHFYTLLPSAGGWTIDEGTLWEVGNEFSARSQLAYATPRAELRNATFDLRHVSDNKRSIPYVVGNAFKVLVPLLEELKEIYVHEMEVIQHTVDLLVSLNASVNSLLVLVLTVLVMRGLWGLLHEMEANALMCQLMASLPHHTTKKIFDFYKQAVASLQELEDEGEERKHLLSEDFTMESPLSPEKPSSRIPAWVNGSPGRGGAAAAFKYDALYMSGRDDGEGGAAGRWLSGEGAPGAGESKWGGEGGSEGRGPSFIARMGQREGEESRASWGSVGGCGPVVLPLTARNLESFRIKQGGAEPGREAPSASASGLGSPYDAVGNGGRGERGARGRGEVEVSMLPARVEMQGAGRGPGVQASLQAEQVLVRRPEKGQGEQGGSDGGSGGEGEGEGAGEGPDPASEAAGGREGEGGAQAQGEAGGGSRTGSGGWGAEPGPGDSSGLTAEQPFGHEDDEASGAAALRLGVAVAAAGRRGGEAGQGGGEGRREEEESETGRVSGAGDAVCEVEGADGMREVGGKEEEGSESGSGPVMRPAWHASSFRASVKRFRVGRESGSGRLAGIFGGSRHGLLTDRSRRTDSPPPARSPKLLRSGLKSEKRARRVSLAEEVHPERQPDAEAAEEGEGRQGRAAPDSFRIAGSFKGGGEHGPPTDMERAALLSEELKVAVRQRRPWFLQTATWLAMFAAVATLCLVSTILATRDFGHLIDLAPVVRVAGERLMLVKAAAFFARELVLDDGFSLMTRQELSDGLLYISHQIKHADRALRLGDEAVGVKVGADVRNAEHNAVMYAGHCPWIEPAWQAKHKKHVTVHRRGGSGEAAGGGLPEQRRRDGGEGEGVGAEGRGRRGGGVVAEANAACADPERPSVGASGLLSVLVAFENALVAVLHRYGLPADAERGEKLLTYQAEMLKELGGAHLPPVFAARGKEQRARLLEEDPDVLYVLQAFDGHLADGMTYVLELLDHELDLILEEAIELNEILYAFYLVTTVLVFWRYLFRRAVNHAEAEAASAKTLVRKMPLHVLTQAEVDGIADYFNDEEEEMDDKHDEAEAAFPGPV